MAIDTTTETLIAFHEATAHVPGRRVHVSTLHRWRLHGVRGRRLETILCGGRRFTSLEAIQRFLQDDASPAGMVAVPCGDPRRVAAAERELDRILDRS
jgi:hypothetical protein